MRLVTCLLLVLVLMGTMFVSGFPYTWDMDNHTDNGTPGPPGPGGPILKGLFDSNDGGVSPWPSIDTALDLAGTAQGLLDQAVAKGLNGATIQALLTQADALLKAAQDLAAIDEEVAIALA